MRDIDRTGMDADTRTSFEVVESAYALALDGFALPYGDIPVGSWRTAPYAVIQNVGAYIDLPRFFQSTHPFDTQDDISAFLVRLQQVPGVLEGERERIVAARELGVVPPGFLLDKAIAQMEATLAQAREGKLFADTARERIDDPGVAEPVAERAALFVRGPVAAALEAQLAELRVQRALATDAPGLGARPHGDEWYRWALRHSTTTTLSPDEVHDQGLDELARLHDRMEPILRQIGYSGGTVGGADAGAVRRSALQVRRGRPRPGRDYWRSSRNGSTGSPRKCRAPSIRWSIRRSRFVACRSPRSRARPPPMAERGRRTEAFRAGCGSTCDRPTCIANTTCPT